jgi:hypothetical protein
MNNVSSGIGGGIDCEGNPLGSIQAHARAKKREAEKEGCTGVTMHPGLQKVAVFMERELPIDELRGVAEALAIIAPAIWSRHPQVKIQPMDLYWPIQKN